ncbi:unnamed protein product [Auanema sp. JU1783]|nr:unnamed protein product [Auanema sp. JU1783]
MSTNLLFIFLLCLIDYSSSRLHTRPDSEPDDPCIRPPANGFITAQQMDFVCQHRRHWLKERDSNVKTWSDASYKQLKYLSNIEHCTRTNCVKEARRRKRATEKSIRKEIRMMTAEERNNLFQAMNGLKGRMIDNITAWDLHTLVHYPDSAPGAHWGAAFLPWHREFLRQFEIALQQEVPSVTLPYWDSTLDEGLPDAADSVLFTDELLGNGNGYVKTGPFKDWDTNVLMPLSQIPVKKLYRSTGGRAQDRLMSPTDVDWITSRKHYKDLTFCHDKTFESIHGLSHVWVGGFMFVIRVSPNDPMFYMHHAFVDYLWEQFRQKQQNRIERETQWAKDVCNPLHAFDVQMKPFRIQNRDGLSNRYTDEWYEYEKVRHCSPDRENCDSPYYWCDVSRWRCRSKVVLGGNCTGYDGQPICLNSVCQQGICTVPPRVRSSMKLRAEQPVTSPLENVWTKTFLIDKDGNGIHSAQVTITNKLTGNNITVFNEEDFSFPEIPGTVYLPLPKPRAGMIQEVQLEARDQNGRYCQSYCYNSTVERHQVCQPNLLIGYRPEASSPIAYTHSFSSRKFLDVDLSVHPKEVVVSAPYMIFACSRKMVTSAMISDLAERTKPIPSFDDTVWLRVGLHRKNIQGLEVEVESNVGAIWTQAVRLAVSPYDPSVLFIKAPNPLLHKNGVRLFVSILEEGRRLACSMKCTMKDGSIKICDGQINLHSLPELSEEDVFTTESSELQLIGWNMRGHPTEWRHKMPYLAFYC